MMSRDDVLAILRGGLAQEWNGVRADQLPDLRGIDLGGFDLSDCRFKEMDLSRADFEFANLSQADFTGATLNGARFRSAHFHYTNLYQACLRDADFRDSRGSPKVNGADLRGATLDDAFLIHFPCEAADLIDVRMTAANLSDVVGNGSTWRGCSVIHSHIDGELTDAKILDGDWSGTELAALDLSRSRIENVRLAGGSWYNVKLTGALLINLDFRDLEIGKCNFSQATQQNCRWK